ncbi:hypothetical protein QBA57_00010 [Streptomyces scabiei]|uniref:hypothetical protein n=1 Tax=Streptomyces scabiei TaxID=1930 RepID=UPI002FF05E26
MTRLAALVQRARCAPDEIGEDVVPAAVVLLRETARTLPVRPIAPDPSHPAATDTVAPQVVAAFADLDRHTRVYAPTTPCCVRSTKPWAPGYPSAPQCWPSN